MKFAIYYGNTKEYNLSLVLLIEIDCINIEKLNEFLNFAQEPMTGHKNCCVITLYLVKYCFKFGSIKTQTMEKAFQRQ